MDLASINAFVAVGDKGGFRAAATSIGMTSAGVSKAVARLESQLGVTLVARTTRSVRLTTAGMSFYHRCKAVLTDLEEAGKAATEGVSSPRGRLVVGMTRTFGRLRVLPIVTDYMRRYPQVDVEARFDDRPANLVADGIDFAVRVGDLPDSSLVVSAIARTRFIVCGSPEYLAGQGMPQHPDDLVGHTMIGYVTPETALHFAFRFIVDGEERVISMPSRLTVDDGEALVAAAARSAGLVMANDYLMAPYLADGRLVRVLEAFELPAIPISIVRPPSRKPSSAATALMELLRRRLSDK